MNTSIGFVATLTDRVIVMPGTTAVATGHDPVLSGIVYIDQAEIDATGPRLQNGIQLADSSVGGNPPAGSLIIGRDFGADYDGNGPIIVTKLDLAAGGVAGLVSAGSAPGGIVRR